MIQIKQYTFDEGQPLICVPVVEAKASQVVETARHLISLKVPVIEWRMDFFEQIEDISQVEKVLKQLDPLMKHTILLVTFRSKKEGGNRDVSYKYYKKLLLYIAENQWADLIDVEVFQVPDVKNFMNQLKEYPVFLVGSHHDFEKTPSENQMIEILTNMEELPVDICKLAVMPDSKADTASLLKVTSEMKQMYPKKPLITMAMGEDGIASRIMGEWFGSCMTFAFVGKSSAPGQISYEKMKALLRVIHTSRGHENENIES